MKSIEVKCDPRDARLLPQFLRAQLLHLRARIENPVVAAAMARGQIEVAGAFYEIGSGAVDFVDTDWKSSPRVMPIEKLSGFN